MSAIPAVWSAPGPLGGSVPWQHSVVRHVVRLFHRSEVEAVGRAEDHVVSSLEGIQKEDLLVRLDELAGDARVRGAIVAFASMGQSPLLALMSESFLASANPWRRLGGVAQHHFSLGLLYASHFKKAAESLPRALRDRSPPDEDLIAAIYDPETPLEIAEALLSVRRAPVCILACAASLDEPRRLPAWAIIALAEQFALSQRSALALIATVATDVPTSVLPHEHRFKLDELERATRERLRRWDGLPAQDSLSE